jgi:hypothetical protein
MGKKKQPKVSLIFDDEERKADLINRMRANKTRKAEHKRKQEQKIKEEKAEFRREKNKAKRQRIEVAREKFEELQRVAESVHAKKERKDQKTFMTDGNEKIKVDITYL